MVCAGVTPFPVLLSLLVSVRIPLVWFELLAHLCCFLCRNFYHCLFSPLRFASIHAFVSSRNRMRFLQLTSLVCFLFFLSLCRVHLLFRGFSLFARPFLCRNWLLVGVTALSCTHFRYWHAHVPELLTMRDFSLLVAFICFIVGLRFFAHFSCLLVAFICSFFLLRLLLWHVIAVVALCLLLFLLNVTGRPVPPFFCLLPLYLSP